jgi:hypothetical protein
VGTCFHEAGHAVVAAALGLEVQNIRINKDDESGHTEVSGHTPSFIEQVACCFAGVEAQAIWEHPSKHLAGPATTGPSLGWLNLSPMNTATPSKRPDPS